MKKVRLCVMIQFAALLSTPTVAVFIGCTPTIMEMIASRSRTLEHPPEADPSIIQDIYFGRTPKQLSFNSDRTDNKNEACFAVPKRRESHTL